MKEWFSNVIDWFVAVGTAIADWVMNAIQAVSGWWSAWNAPTRQKIIIMVLILMIAIVSIANLIGVLTLDVKHKRARAAAKAAARAAAEKRKVFVTPAWRIVVTRKGVSARATAAAVGTGASASSSTGGYANGYAGEPSYMPYGDSYRTPYRDPHENYDEENEEEGEDVYESNAQGYPYRSAYAPNDTPTYAPTYTPTDEDTAKEPQDTYQEYEQEPLNENTMYMDESEAPETEGIYDVPREEFEEYANDNSAADVADADFAEEQGAYAGEEVEAEQEERRPTAEEERLTAELERITAKIATLTTRLQEMEDAEKARAEAEEQPADPRYAEEDEPQEEYTGGGYMEEDELPEAEAEPEPETEPAPEPEVEAEAEPEPEEVELEPEPEQLEFDQEQEELLKEYERAQARKKAKGKGAAQAETEEERAAALEAARAAKEAEIRSAAANDDEFDPETDDIDVVELGATDDREETANSNGKKGKKAVKRIVLEEDDSGRSDEEEPIAESGSASTLPKEYENMAEPSEFLAIQDEDGEVTEVVKRVDYKSRIAVVVRYRKSFTAKLIQCSDETKSWYAEMKNDFLSYKKVKSRLSWKYDSINLGRVALAKFAIRGKTLCVYFALDPKEFAGSRYKVEADTGRRFAEVPCMYRIKNRKRAKYAMQLFALLAERNHLMRMEETRHEDYYRPYENTMELLGRNLIKEVYSRESLDDFLQKRENSVKANAAKARKKEANDDDDE